jgi:hypothetical protein
MKLEELDTDRVSREAYLKEKGIVMKDGILVAEGYLPKHLCDRMIQQFHNTEQDTSNIYSNYDRKKGGDIITDMDPEIARYVTELFSEYREKYFLKEKSLYYTNKNLIIQYLAGDDCFYHYDGVGLDKAARYINVTICLNDEFTGGECIMPYQNMVLAGLGTISFFPAMFMYPHYVLPVGQGERYIFLGAIMYDEDFSQCEKSKGIRLVDMQNKCDDQWKTRGMS